MSLAVDAMGSEVVLDCAILNRMTALGRPASYRLGREESWRSASCGPMTTLRKSSLSGSIGPSISPHALSVPKTVETSSLGKIFSAVRSRNAIRRH